MFVERMYPLPTVVCHTFRGGSKPPPYSNFAILCLGGCSNVAGILLGCGCVGVQFLDCAGEFAVALAMGTLETPASVVAGDSLTVIAKNYAFPAAVGTGVIIGYV